MSKYIDADLLAWKIKRQIRLEKLNFAALGGGGQTFCINTLEWVLKQIDSLQQEQPSLPDNLDEAAEKSSAQYYKDAGYSPFPNVETAAHKAGFIAGAEWQKEQMLKEAVEGFVATHLTSEGTKVTVNSGYLPKEMCIKPGDKVRIIIVKEEK